MLGCLTLSYSCTGLFVAQILLLLLLVGAGYQLLQTQGDMADAMDTIQQNQLLLDAEEISYEDMIQ